VLENILLIGNKLSISCGFIDREHCTEERLLIEDARKRRFVVRFPYREERKPQLEEMLPQRKGMMPPFEETGHHFNAWFPLREATVGQQEAILLKTKRIYMCGDRMCRCERFLRLDIRRGDL
jgi:hypothetical protein